ncbi:PP2C family protein-serine/threonine phosphatase [Aestuariimicrobium kwangyangense]|uniref:PP2C family protein-serine/threonine phosphatase n=1 Tax=Aestuariimicrobium kwangyangense TaxID=396389 RepID=UPI0003B6B34A|nr:PP2C family protein-serine/threonine phosphatase [Aestuariimicrobium kwangyangense]
MFDQSPPPEHQADEPTRVLQRPQEAPERTRHAEAPAAWVGVATEIGRRHRTNQDAYSAGVSGDWAALVVCDGVSSSIGAERASQVAATTVRNALLDAVGPDADRDWDATFGSAYQAAQRAVLALGEDGSPVGSCTLVAALVHGHEIHLGNIGDTRAYWVPDAPTPGAPAPATVQLSVDDSLAQAQIELGYSREQAESSRQAHAITRWIGPDAPELNPRMRHFRAEAPGILVVCSDGLWNYASAPEAMGDLVGRTLAEVGGGRVAAGASTDLRDVARTLTEWACQQGGRDNITVALAHVD